MNVIANGVAAERVDGAIGIATVVAVVAMYLAAIVESPG